MNTGYYEKGIYQFERYNIIEHYLSNYFLSDVITNVSLLFINSYPYISLLFFNKIYFFLHLLKKLEETFDLSWKSKNIIKLFKLAANMLFIAHLFACIWLLEARIFTINEDSNVENWMVFKDVNMMDLQSKYITALYYVIVTMSTVGYGDISPKNNIEMLIGIGFILVACGNFAFTINSIGAIF